MNRDRRARIRKVIEELENVSTSLEWIFNEVDDAWTICRRACRILSDMKPCRTRWIR